MKTRGGRLKGSIRYSGDHRGRGSLTKRSSCSAEPSAFVTQNFCSGVTKRSGDGIAIDYISARSDSLSYFPLPLVCTSPEAEYQRCTIPSPFQYTMNYLSTNTFNEIDRFIYIIIFYCFCFYGTVTFLSRLRRFVRIDSAWRQAHQSTQAAQ